MYQQRPMNNPPYPGFPPPNRPLSIGRVIKQLFIQYVRVYTAPSHAAFAVEVQKAEWSIVWVQMFSLSVFLFLDMIVIHFIIALVLAMFASLAGVLHDRLGTILYSIFGFESLTISLGFLLLVPSLFLLIVFFQYLIARSFGGKGTLVQHAYGCALIYAPLPFIMSFVVPVAALVPIVNILLPLLLPLLPFYVIALTILMLMAVHRIGGGKAAVVVFFPLIVLFLFLFVFFIQMLISAS